MRAYAIYKVKEMYQPFIIGRERLLYDLLKEDGHHSDDLPEVHYLCDKLEEKMIDEAIIMNLGKGFPTVASGDNEYKLTHPVKGSIVISQSSLFTQCHLRWIPHVGSRPVRRFIQFGRSFLCRYGRARGMGVAEARQICGPTDEGRICPFDRTIKN